MGKRKGSRGGGRDGKPGGPAGTSSPSVARWETRDEIPLDDEERFHHDRDHVMLGGAVDDGDESDAGESFLIALPLAL